MTIILTLMKTLKDARSKDKKFREEKENKQNARKIAQQMLNKQCKEGKECASLEK